MAFLFAFAVVLDRFLAWSGRIDSDLLRGLLRGSFIGIMLMGPILVGSTLMTDEAVASDAPGQPLDGCGVRDVAGYLETDPPRTEQRRGGQESVIPCILRCVPDHYKKKN